MRVQGINVTLGNTVEVLVDRKRNGFGFLENIKRAVEVQAA